MSERLILELALRSMDDPSALPVLGDAVQEAGWCDVRVMSVMWPIREGWTRDLRLQARRHREATLITAPAMFAAFASRPSRGWACAIAAVLLFGAWRQRGRWPVVRRTPLYCYRDEKLKISLALVRAHEDLEAARRFSR